MHERFVSLLMEASNAFRPGNPIDPQNTGT